MTIHSEHPFAVPASEREPLRQLRGRMPQPVTLWCAELDGRRVGWTVSSTIVSAGDPAELVGVLDPESDLADVIAETGRFTVNLLGWRHRALGDPFAGIAPAPGGIFTLGTWQDTEWGPVLTDAVGWIGAEAAEGSSRLGWSQLVRATCAHVSVAALPTDGLLTHVRGRYRRIPVEL